MKTIAYYLRIYKHFVITSFSEALSFRLNFVFTCIFQLVFYASAFAIVHLLYTDITHIGPWNKTQFMFFTAFTLSVIEITNLVLTRNCWEFSVLLIKGDLDFLLLRPAGALFSTFFRYARPFSLLLLPIPLSVLALSGQALELSFLQWCICIPLLILSSVLYISLNILLCLAMFWSFQGIGVNFIRLQVAELSRWPDFIFSPVSRYILSFLFPILLVGSAPTSFLYSVQSYSLLIYEVLAICVIWMLIRIIWNIGLTHYESASS